MPLVHLLAHRLRGRARHLQREDLVQAGVIGLMRAIEKYDPARGVAASTFLYPWIRQAMNRAIDNQDRDVRIPVGRLERRDSRERLPVEVSWDAPLGDGSEPERRSLHDLIAGPSETPEREAEREQDGARLEAALAKLPARTRQVLRARYWGDLTLKEAGAEIGGLSRERVRQLEAEGLLQLRRALSASAAS